MKKTSIASMLVLALLLCACGEPGHVQIVSSHGNGAAGEAGGSGNGAATRIELTDALLHGYAQGLRKEAEILRRPGRGRHYGVMISAVSGDAESAEVLAAAGMSAADYLAVRHSVDQVFNTLNFQGRIGPPRSINLALAGEEMKRRLAGDPFDELPPASAEALRRHLDALVPPWSDIVAMTAQHG